MATTNDELIYIIPTFDAGMQTRSSLFLNAQNELRLGKNIDLQYIIGGISKALGYTQKGNEIAVARTLLGCGSLNTSGGTDKLLAFANKVSTGADAYVYNSSTEAWDAQSRSYTAGQSFETAKFLNQLFVVNGLTDAPENYTGAAWSAAAHDTGPTFRINAGNTEHAQGFKPTGANVSSVKLYLKKTGAPTGNIYIQIQADNAGAPSNSSLGQSVNVDVSTLTTSYNWVEFTFSSPVTVTPGTQYHIVVFGSFTIDGNNYVNVAAVTTGAYADGAFSYRGTGAWTGTANDLYFEEHSTTALDQLYSGMNVVDMPKAKFIREYEVRLFLFNINVPVGGSFPSRVWYSNLPKNNAIVWGFESGTDLVTTASSAVITSATSLFKTRGIKSGDPITITNGADTGEYIVLTVDSETQLTLRTNLTATATAKSYWVGGNWFDISRDNSDVGMGIGDNAGRLLLFKRFSLSRFLKTNDSATDSLEVIKGVPGTVAHRSIVNVKNYTIYAADSGIWRYNGVTSELISGPIQEVWDGVPATNYSSIFGWQSGDRLVKIYVGDVSNATTGLTISKCVMVYDASSDAWWTEALNDAVKCGSTWVNSSAKKHYAFSDGKALETELGSSFDDVAIDMEAETPFHFPIAPEVSVNFTRFKIYTESGRSMEVQYKLAYFEDSGEVVVDDDWRELGVIDKSDREQNLKPDESNNKAAGFALKFGEASTTGRPTVLRVAAFYSGKDLR